jgi:hypothetical protein
MIIIIIINNNKKKRGEELQLGGTQYGKRR